MIDPSIVKLGKLPARHDDRTLKLRDYLTPSALPPIPDNWDWTVGITDWRMFGNDVAGDCVVAGAEHMRMAWTNAANGSPVVIPDKEPLDVYSALSGYDPTTGANDNGLDVLSFLNWWRTTGFTSADGSVHKLGAFAILTPTNLLHINASGYLFGGVFAGWQMPNSAQGQNSWTYMPQGDNSPGGWGGHLAPIVKKGSVCSWGGVIPFDGAFYSNYCDEAYALFSQDFLNGAGRTITGFDAEALLTDMQLVTQ